MYIIRRTHPNIGDLNIIMQAGMYFVVGRKISGITYTTIGLYSITAARNVFEDKWKEWRAK